MKSIDYTQGTLRKEVPEEVPHWIWGVLGAAIAVFCLGLVGIYIAEALV